MPEHSVKGASYFNPISVRVSHFSKFKVKRDWDRVSWPKMPQGSPSVAPAALTVIIVTEILVEGAGPVGDWRGAAWPESWRPGVTPRWVGALRDT